MSDWGKMIMAMVSIAILGFAAWIFKIDLQLLLLVDIAYEVTYIRIGKEEEKK